VTGKFVKREINGGGNNREKRREKCKSEGGKRTGDSLVKLLPYLAKGRGHAVA
jgi:hypothetical protein